MRYIAPLALALAIPVIALAADTPAVVSREILRTDTSVTGQPLKNAAGAGYQLVSVRTTLQPGGGIAPHKHPYPRFSYVISGRIALIDVESGVRREFGPGDAIAEPVDRWHAGEVIGSEPVELVAFDQVPTGQTNVIREP